MNEFKDFKETMQQQFESMLEGQDQLFVTEFGKDFIWEAYLKSFPDTDKGKLLCRVHDW